MAKDKGDLRADLKIAQAVVRMARRNLKQAPDERDAAYWRQFLSEAQADEARLQRELESGHEASS